MPSHPLVDVVPASDPRSWQRDAATAVRRWTAPITDAGVRVAIDIDRDIRPVAAIRRAVDAHPGAAVCLGLRGLSEVSGIRVGHLARHHLRHTDVPLMLVPRAATT